MVRASDFSSEDTGFDPFAGKDEGQLCFLDTTRDDLARWLERRTFNTKALGSIPWWGRMRESCVFLTLHERT